MAQESIDYFIQMAKDYEKAEKELEVQHWVFVNFSSKDKSNNYDYVHLFSYNLPREIYERRKWVIEWRKAKLVCQYPKGCVRYTLHFYDKRLGKNIQLNKDLNRLISAKAQVTKAQRKIDKYVAYNKANNLFFDESTDTDLLKAREKLETKIANIKEAEERLKLKIKQIKEKSNEVRT